MSENVYHLLRLEQRFESCQRVHQEELDEIRRAIVELRNQILFNFPMSRMGLKEGNDLTDKGNPAGLSKNQDDRIQQKPQ